MTTDKELLELAAKAFGISGKYVTDFGSGDYYYAGNLDGIYYDLPDGGYTVWNPLTNDGDALRLAVKLGMIIGTYANYSTVDVLSNKRINTIEVWHSKTQGDVYAATRLAIVRAAAEIGKSV